MNINELALLTAPIHGILQRIAASEIRQVGIFPERLTLSFEISHEREPKFNAAITRILEVADTFDFGSPLCVFVFRSAKMLSNGELDWSEWHVQFQVNQRDGFDPAIVENQVNAILFELESYLFD